MSTATEMIARARAAQEAKEGVRMPVRFSPALIARARKCADDVDEQIGDWVNKACRQWQSGKFSGVSDDEKTELATREASEVITIRAPQGMPSSDIKKAVSACCLYCEPRRRIYTPDPIPVGCIIEVPK